MNKWLSTAHRFTVILLLLTVTSTAQAETSDTVSAGDFRASVMKFDVFHRACDLGCVLSHPVVKDILGLIAEYYGADPDTVEVVKTIIPTTRDVGQEKTFDLSYPIDQDYVYCGSEVAVTSLMSAESHRPTVIDVKLFDDHLGIYTWADTPTFFRPQSSVEGVAVTISVKKKFHAALVEKGICRRPPPQYQWRALLTCSSNPCNPARDGLPPGHVASITDNAQARYATQSIVSSLLLGKH